jgi:hypothetical protein
VGPVPRDEAVSAVIHASMSSSRPTVFKNALIAMIGNVCVHIGDEASGASAP